MATPLVLNIPHSSFDLPASVNATITAPRWVYVYETLIQLDWFTDSLFDLPGGHQVVAPVNRIGVDTERLIPDALEPMAAHGMGAINTHGTRGYPLREGLTDSDRDALLGDWYHPHHQRLEQAVDAALAEQGQCLLVDGHSFPDTPFPYEQDQTSKRPDICLGTIEGNTPAGLVDVLVEQFTELGYSVAVDWPFSGCVVPERFQGDHRVQAVMVELNRALYLDQRTPEYADTVEDEANLPGRGPGFFPLKRDLHTVFQAALGQVTGKAPNWAPFRQQMLARFHREVTDGNVSPEMRVWWAAQY